jgi:peptidoglycan/LPS O-acetylase OafA/YrhL
VSERLPVLDGLRATSILLVLGAHMLPLGPKVLRLNETAGAMGMSLFFALSGFLIVSGLRHNPDIPEFLVRRLSRIVPLAYGYVLFAFSFLLLDAQDALWTMSFLVNYLPAHLSDYNAHFWSLCVEAHFYLAIALAVLALGEKGIWLVWPTCLLVTALRVNAGAYIHIETHLRVDEILAGACVATIYRASWTGRYRHAALLAMAAVSACLVSSSPYFEWVQYLRPYASASLLGVALCLAETRLGALLASRPMRYIAATSYALYVIHPLADHGWLNQGGVFERYLIKRPLGFLLTFAAAHVSTFFWERPWMDAGRRWINRRRAHRLQAA